VASLSTWSPIVLVIAFLVLAAVAYFFRSRGEARYKKGTIQAEIFLSGEAPPEPAPVKEPADAGTGGAASPDDAPAASDDASAETDDAGDQQGADTGSGD